MAFLFRAFTGADKQKERQKSADVVNKTFQAELNNVRSKLEVEDDELQSLVEMIYDSVFPESQKFLKDPTKDRLNANKETISSLLFGLAAQGVPVTPAILVHIQKHGFDAIADTLLTLLELVRPLLASKDIPEFTSDDLLDAIDVQWHSSSPAFGGSQFQSPLQSPRASASMSPRGSVSSPRSPFSTQYSGVLGSPRHTTQPQGLISPRKTQSWGSYFRSRSDDSLLSLPESGWDGSSSTPPTPSHFTSTSVDRTSFLPYGAEKLQPLAENDEELNQSAGSSQKMQKNRAESVPRRETPPQASSTERMQSVDGDKDDSALSGNKLGNSLTFSSNGDDDPGAERALQGFSRARRGIKAANPPYGLSFNNGQSTSAPAANIPRQSLSFEIYRGNGVESSGKTTHADSGNDGQTSSSPVNLIEEDDEEEEEDKSLGRSFSDANTADGTLSLQKQGVKNTQDVRRYSPLQGEAAPAHGNDNPAGNKLERDVPFPSLLLLSKLEKQIPEVDDEMPTASPEKHMEPVDGSSKDGGNSKHLNVGTNVYVSNSSLHDFNSKGELDREVSLTEREPADGPTKDAQNLNENEDHNALVTENILDNFDAEKKLDRDLLFRDLHPLRDSDEVQKVEEGGKLPKEKYGDNASVSVSPSGSDHRENDEVQEATPDDTLFDDSSASSLWQGVEGLVASTGVEKLDQTQLSEEKAGMEPTQVSNIAVNVENSLPFEEEVDDKASKSLVVDSDDGFLSSNDEVLETLQLSNVSSQGEDTGPDISDMMANEIDAHGEELVDASPITVKDGESHEPVQSPKESELNHSVCALNVADEVQTLKTLHSSDTTPQVDSEASMDHKQEALKNDQEAESPGASDNTPKENSVQPVDEKAIVGLTDCTPVEEVDDRGFKSPVADREAAVMKDNGAMSEMLGAPDVDTQDDAEAINREQEAQREHQAAQSLFLTEDVANEDSIQLIEEKTVVEASDGTRGPDVGDKVVKGPVGAISARMPGAPGYMEGFKGMSFVNGENTGSEIDAENMSLSKIPMPFPENTQHEIVSQEEPSSSAPRDMVSGYNTASLLRDLEKEPDSSQHVHESTLDSPEEETEQSKEDGITNPASSAENEGSPTMVADQSEEEPVQLKHEHQQEKAGDAGEDKSSSSSSSSDDDEESSPGSSSSSDNDESSSSSSSSSDDDDESSPNSSGESEDGSSSISSEDESENGSSYLPKEEDEAGSNVLAMSDPDLGEALDLLPVQADKQSEKDLSELRPRNDNGENASMSVKADEDEGSIVTGRAMNDSKLTMLPIQATGEGSTSIDGSELSLRNDEDRSSSASVRPEEQAAKLHEQVISKSSNLGVGRAFMVTDRAKQEEPPRLTDFEVSSSENQDVASLFSLQSHEREEAGGTENVISDSKLPPGEPRECEIPSFEVSPSNKESRTSRLSVQVDGEEVPDSAAHDSKTAEGEKPSSVGAENVEIAGNDGRQESPTSMKAHSEEEELPGKVEHDSGLTDAKVLSSSQGEDDELPAHTTDSVVSSSEIEDVEAPRSLQSQEQGEAGVAEHVMGETNSGGEHLVSVEAKDRHIAGSEVSPSGIDVGASKLFEQADEEGHSGGRHDLELVEDDFPAVQAEEGQAAVMSDSVVSLNEQEDISTRSSTHSQKEEETGGTEHTVGELTSTKGKELLSVEAGDHNSTDTVDDDSGKAPVAERVDEEGIHGQDHKSKLAQGRDSLPGQEEGDESGAIEHVVGEPKSSRSEDLLPFEANECDGAGVSRFEVSPSSDDGGKTPVHEHVYGEGVSGEEYISKLPECEDSLGGQAEEEEGGATEQAVGESMSIEGKELLPVEIKEGHIAGIGSSPSNDDGGDVFDAEYESKLAEGEHSLPVQTEEEETSATEHVDGESKPLEGEDLFPVQTNKLAFSGLMGPEMFPNSDQGEASTPSMEVDEEEQPGVGEHDPKVSGGQIRLLYQAEVEKPAATSDSEVSPSKNDDGEVSLAVPSQEQEESGVIEHTMVVSKSPEGDELFPAGTKELGVAGMSESEVSPRSDDADISSSSVQADAEDVPGSATHDSEVAEHEDLLPGLDGEQEDVASSRNKRQEGTGTSVKEHIYERADDEGEYEANSAEGEYSFPVEGEEEAGAPEHVLSESKSRQGELESNKRDIAGSNSPEVASSIDDGGKASVDEGAISGEENESKFAEGKQSSPAEEVEAPEVVGGKSKSSQGEDLLLLESNQSDIVGVSSSNLSPIGDGGGKAPLSEHVDEEGISGEEYESKLVEGTDPLCDSKSVGNEDFLLFEPNERDSAGISSSEASRDSENLGKAPVVEHFDQDVVRGEEYGSKLAEGKDDAPVQADEEEAGAAEHVLESSKLTEGEDLLLLESDECDIAGSSPPEVSPNHDDGGNAPVSESTDGADVLPAKSSEHDVAAISSIEASLNNGDGEKAPVSAHVGEGEEYQSTLAEDENTLPVQAEEEEAGATEHVAGNVKSTEGEDLLPVQFEEHDIADMRSSEASPGNDDDDAGASKSTEAEDLFSSHTSEHGLSAMGEHEVPISDGGETSPPSMKVAEEKVPGIVEHDPRFIAVESSVPNQAEVEDPAAIADSEVSPPKTDDGEVSLSAPPQEQEEFGVIEHVMLVSKLAKGEELLPSETKERGVVGISESEVSPRSDEGVATSSYVQADDAEVPGGAKHDSTVAEHQDLWPVLAEEEGTGSSSNELQEVANDNERVTSSILREAKYSLPVQAEEDKAAATLDPANTSSAEEHVPSLSPSVQLGNGEGVVLEEYKPGLFEESGPTLEKSASLVEVKDRDTPEQVDPEEHEAAASDTAGASILPAPSENLEANDDGWAVVQDRQAVEEPGTSLKESKVAWEDGNPYPGTLAQVEGGRVGGTHESKLAEGDSLIVESEEGQAGATTDSAVSSSEKEDVDASLSSQSQEEEETGATEQVVVEPKSSHGEYLLPVEAEERDLTRTSSSEVSPSNIDGGKAPVNENLDKEGVSGREYDSKSSESVEMVESNDHDISGISSSKASPSNADGEKAPVSEHDNEEGISGEEYKSKLAEDEGSLPVQDEEEEAGAAENVVSESKSSEGENFLSTVANKQHVTGISSTEASPSIENGQKASVSEHVDDEGVAGEEYEPKLAKEKNSFPVQAEEEEAGAPEVVVGEAKSSQDEDLSLLESHNCDIVGTSSELSPSSDYVEIAPVSESVHVQDGMEEATADEHDMGEPKSSEGEEFLPNEANEQNPAGISSSAETHNIENGKTASMCELVDEERISGEEDESKLAEGEGSAPVQSGGQEAGENVLGELKSTENEDLLLVESSEGDVTGNSDILLSHSNDDGEKAPVDEHIAEEGVSGEEYGSKLAEGNDSIPVQGEGEEAGATEHVVGESKSTEGEALLPVESSGHDVVGVNRFEVPPNNDGGNNAHVSEHVDEEGVSGEEYEAKLAEGNDSLPVQAEQEKSGAEFNLAEGEESSHVQAEGEESGATKHIVGEREATEGEGLLHVEANECNVAGINNIEGPPSKDNGEKAPVDDHVDEEGVFGEEYEPQLAECADSVPIQAGGQESGATKTSLGESKSTENEDLLPVESSEGDITGNSGFSFSPSNYDGEKAHVDGHDDEKGVSGEEYESMWTEDEDSTPVEGEGEEAGATEHIVGESKSTEGEDLLPVESGGHDVVGVKSLEVSPNNDDSENALASEHVDEEGVSGEEYEAKLAEGKDSLAAQAEEKEAGATEHVVGNSKSNDGEGNLYSESNEHDIAGNSNLEASHNKDNVENAPVSEHVKEEGVRGEESESQLVVGEEDEADVTEHVVGDSMWTEGEDLLPKRSNEHDISGISSSKASPGNADCEKVPVFEHDIEEGIPGEEYKSKLAEGKDSLPVQDEEEEAGAAENVVSESKSSEREDYLTIAANKEDIAGISSSELSPSSENGQKASVSEHVDDEGVSSEEYESKLAEEKHSLPVQAGEEKAGALDIVGETKTIQDEDLLSLESKDPDAGISDSEVSPSSDAAGKAHLPEHVDEEGISEEYKSKLAEGEHSLPDQAKEEEVGATEQVLGESKLTEDEDSLPVKGEEDKAASTLDPANTLGAEEDVPSLSPSVQLGNREGVLPEPRLFEECGTALEKSASLGSEGLEVKDRITETPEEDSEQHEEATSETAGAPILPPRSENFEVDDGGGAVVQDRQAVEEPDTSRKESEVPLEDENRNPESEEGQAAATTGFAASSSEKEDVEASLTSQSRKEEETGATGQGVTERKSSQGEDLLPVEADDRDLARISSSQVSPGNDDGEETPVHAHLEEKGVPGKEYESKSTEGEDLLPVESNKSAVAGMGSYEAPPSNADGEQAPVSKYVDAEGEPQEEYESKSDEGKASLPNQDEEKQAGSPEHIVGESKSSKGEFIPPIEAHERDLAGRTDSATSPSGDDGEKTHVSEHGDEESIFGEEDKSRLAVGQHSLPDQPEEEEPGITEQLVGESKLTKWENLVPVEAAVPGMIGPGVSHNSEVGETSSPSSEVAEEEVRGVVEHNPKSSEGENLSVDQAEEDNPAMNANLEVSSAQNDDGESSLSVPSQENKESGGIDQAVVASKMVEGDKLPAESKELGNSQSDVPARSEEGGISSSSVQADDEQVPGVATHGSEVAGHGDLMPVLALVSERVDEEGSYGQDHESNLAEGTDSLPVQEEGDEADAIEHVMDEPKPSQGEDLLAVETNERDGAGISNPEVPPSNDDGEITPVDGEGVSGEEYRSKVAEGGQAEEEEAGAGAQVVDETKSIEAKDLLPVQANEGHVVGTGGSEVSPGNESGEPVQAEEQETTATDHVVGVSKSSPPSLKFDGEEVPGATEYDPNLPDSEYLLPDRAEEEKPAMTADSEVSPSKSDDGEVSVAVPSQEQEESGIVEHATVASELAEGEEMLPAEKKEPGVAGISESEVSPRSEEGGISPSSVQAGGAKHDSQVAEHQDLPPVLAEEEEGTGSLSNEQQEVASGNEHATSSNLQEAEHSLPVQGEEDKAAAMLDPANTSSVEEHIPSLSPSVRFGNHERGGHSTAVTSEPRSVEESRTALERSASPLEVSNRNADALQQIDPEQPEVATTDADGDSIRPTQSEKFEAEDDGGAVAPAQAVEDSGFSREELKPALDIESQYPGTLAQREDKADIPDSYHDEEKGEDRAPTTIPETVSKTPLAGAEPVEVGTKDTYFHTGEPVADAQEIRHRSNKEVSDMNGLKETENQKGPESTSPSDVSEPYFLEDSGAGGKDKVELWNPLAIAAPVEVKPRGILQKSGDGGHQTDGRKNAEENLVAVSQREELITEGQAASNSNKEREEEKGADKSTVKNREPPRPAWAETTQAFSYLPRIKQQGYDEATGPEYSFTGPLEHRTSKNGQGEVLMRAFTAPVRVSKPLESGPDGVMKSSSTSGIEEGNQKKNKDQKYEGGQQGAEMIQAWRLPEFPAAQDSNLGAIARLSPVHPARAVDEFKSGLNPTTQFSFPLPPASSEHSPERKYQQDGKYMRSRRWRFCSKLCCCCCGSQAAT